MCSVSLKDGIPSKKLNSFLGVSRVTDVVRHGRLRWFGHLERMCVDDWVSACKVFEVPGDKGRGRGRKTWGECVDGDLRLLGLKMVHSG